jgi:hypothetical protein
LWWNRRVALGESRLFFFSCFIYFGSLWFLLPLALLRNYGRKADFVHPSLILAGGRNSQVLFPQDELVHPMCHSANYGKYDWGGIHIVG